MKKNILLISVILIVVSSCNKPKTIDKIIDESLAFSMKQYSLMYDVMKEKPDLLPRTLDTTGALVTAKSNW